MKLKYTLAVGALALATASQAQSWIADTMKTDTSYLKDAYYNLNTGQVASVANNNWHIAFQTDGITQFGAPVPTVMVNHAGNGINGKLYDLGLDAATKWGQNLVADTVGKTAGSMELKNQPAYWEDAAFNQNPSGPTNFGWGEYDVNTHFINGNKVYLLVNSAGAFQIWLEQYQISADRNALKWIFHVGRIDGTDTITHTFAPAPTYNNKLFAYYNAATHQFIDREPVISDWHLLATKYVDTGYMPGLLLSTTGIVSNVNVELATQSNLPPNNATQAMATAATYLDTRNVIGGKYKALNGSNQWEVHPNLSYFIRIKKGVDSGDIWQVYFDYFPTATTNVNVKIGLQKRKIYDYTAPVSVTELNPFVQNVMLVPNPTVGGATNLLIDVKQDIKDARITIVDLGGRVVMNTTRSIKAGLQQMRLDVSSYRAGVYMVNISGAGFNTTQKMVIK
ncbi:T9SS type A sorting domain-containing protein [Taibaiella koreensis]|uniref:T9SS type A sorting domain-containing protein n=1 Tax=Taibaiella koreensis TaxID=1268548 RepID=UPI0013C301EC|nr:T9SS type A sorting domain-containing protein [Taibaiella koreensis]